MNFSLPFLFVVFKYTIVGKIEQIVVIYSENYTTFEFLHQTTTRMLYFDAEFFNAYLEIYNYSIHSILQSFTEGQE